MNGEPETVNDDLEIIDCGLIVTDSELQIVDYEKVITCYKLKNIDS